MGVRATAREGRKPHITREEHPLVAVVTHNVHLVALIALVFTGFFIHSPFYRGSMQTNRTIHLISAWILIASGVIRIYWAFFGRGSAPTGSRRKMPDYKFFLPQKENRGKTLETLRYYLFLRRTHPRILKYNPLQKGTYWALILLSLIQIITGFELWTPTLAFFSPLTYALGGPIYVRMIHYIVAWLFIVITALHIYLVLIEARPELPLMFLYREPGEVTMSDGGEEL
ncbi:MAG: cytochrome b/b6 domain-containing protein [Candidatus Aquicultor sp.]